MKSLKRIARRYYFKHILICTLINLMLFYAPLSTVLANPNPANGTLPTGHTTPYGGVGSFDSSPGRLDIQNVSNGAVINWQKFDIGAGATTEFHQVNSSAYVLNRVSASDGLASGIKGNLIANGNIIVMNPHGIVIGPSALINAGKFVASGLGITDKNFRDFAGGSIGVLKFDTDCISGNVTNNGTINGREAVYLVGNSVTNTGTISCPGGMVVMAAGEKVYLAQSGSNVVIEKLDTGYDAGNHVVTSGGTIDAPGAGILLAAGDIYSQAVITGARSFVAQADRDITITKSIQTTGNIDIWADELGDTLGDVYAGYNKITGSVTNVPITAGGNVNIRGNEVRLGGAVKAGADEFGNIVWNDKDLTITGRACLGGETVWYDIYAYSTLEAGRDIVISNTGEEETVTWVPSGKCGGEWVYDTKYSPGTIYLYDNVTAGRNLSIYNNTYTGAGITLRAGNNIILAEDGIEASALANCSWLRGTEWLALRAGNEIQAPKTVISVSGSTLIMEQGLSLNLDNYLFANQVNTDLTLISNHGSVTAVETGTKPGNAADQWKSIGATADNGSDNGGNAIHLSGNQKDIVATELRAYHDDITVNAKTAKVRATENVTADTGSINLVANTDIEASKNLVAGSDISATAGNNILLKGNANAGKNINLTAVADVEAQGNLTAGQDVTISSSDTTTYLGGNVYAGNNVLLNNNTKLNGAGDQSITAGSGTMLAKGTLTKTTGGRMSVLAADGIALSGAAASVDSMYLDADTDEDGIGDMLAQSTLTTTTGNIEISASDSTIKLQDNVSAGQDLILNNNTEVAAGKKLDAGRDVTVAANKTLKGKGALTVEADRHITLGGPVAASDEVDGDLVLWADKNADNDGDMAASGTIHNPGGSIDIYSSDNTTYLGGDWVVAGDNITLHNNTVLNGGGNQRIEATTGTLTANKNLDKTTAGNLNLAGGTGINLDGTVNVEAGSLVIEDDFTAAGDLLASDNVTLNGAGTLDGTANQRIDAENGALWAKNTITKTGTGNLNLAGQTGINLDGTVDVEAGSLTIEDDFTAAGDLLASDNVTLNGTGTLDGTTDQRIDAKNGMLSANGTLTKTGTGNLNLGGQTGINLDGTVDVEAGSLVVEDDFAAAGDLLASDNITLNGTGTLDGTSDQRIDAENGALWAKNTITKTGTGNLNLAGQTGINLDGTVDVQAGSLTVEDDVTAAGDLLANDNVTLNGTATLDGAGDQSITAKNGMVLANGTVTKTTTGRMSVLAADGITLENAASAQDSMYLDADTDEDGIGDMLAQSTLTTTTGNIEISASDSTIKLQDNVSAGQDLILNNNTEVAADKELKAGQDVSLAGGKTITGTGNLAVRAGRNISLGGDVTTLNNGNMTIIANPASSTSNVYAYGKLTSGGDMLVEAGDSVYLEATPDSAYAGGDMIITAGEFGEDVSGNLEVAGNLAAEGDITLSSSDDTTYLGGDVYAGHDITLNNNTIVNGYGDQTLEAGNKLTACGYVRKETSGDMYMVGNSDDLAVDLRYNGEGAGTSTSQGNLWILGRGDIQISGDVTTFGPSEYEYLKSEISVEGQTGGVAIISDEGKIYTEGGNDDTLNISVTGSSDHFNGTGVYGFGPYASAGVIEPTILAESGNTEAKAAIAIVSADELKLGEDARLTARGTYYDNVDDRASIGFLDVDAEIPASTPRNQGVGFDLAVYTASKNSSVTIDCPVTITSTESQPPVPTIFSMEQFIEQEFVAKGAMAIDAYDIVTLGEKFRQSLANGDIGNRLEVCSRITEWLDDAVGRLPFPGDLDLPIGYSYVMRGAGLENPEITDGRAWVLERKVEPFTEAAPIQQPELKSTGCPAVMNWVAQELGVEKDQIQIYISGALALSGNVQPCDICAKLQSTALALKDADGTQIKALGQVINEFAGAGAPPSEEQMAMIASALQNPKEGTQYALAAQWLNALAEYTNILHNDLQMPVNESVARAAKYASPVVNGDNAALAAFVQAKLAGLGS